MGNLMMDGRALYPNAWHPQAFRTQTDGCSSLHIPSMREVKSVRYYFIDFGLSTINRSSTTGYLGQERAPELSYHIPYDPYKLDVYSLGMAYYRLCWLVRSCGLLAERSNT